MKFWWLTDSARLAAEKVGVETLARDESWFEHERWLFHEGRLSTEGVLVAHGHRYPIRLVYPDRYPEVPAWVEPQSEVRWTTHQYGEGPLCLELRPDNWTAAATGVDVLRSAHNLLMIENPLGEGEQRAPSAHDVGELQAYDWGPSPVLIGSGCAARIRAGRASSVSALRWMVHDDVRPIMVHDEEDRRAVRRPPGPDVTSWRFEVPVFVSDEPPPPAGPVDRAGLVGAAAFDPETAATVEASTAGLVIFVGGAELEAIHLVADGGTHRRRIFILAEEDGVRSARPAMVAAKRVTIVGAGSVGSKIAEAILRSGVHRLTGC